MSNKLDISLVPIPSSVGMREGILDLVSPKQNKLPYKSYREVVATIFISIL